MTENTQWWVLIEGPNEDDNHAFGFGTADQPINRHEAMVIALGNVPDGGGFALYRLYDTETNR
jgi:hypothetical protein